MTTFYCAVVGVTASAFPVEIDPGLSVGHLKDAIKEKKKNELKEVDANELQLFLAKRKTKEANKEEWLTQLDTLQGVSDTSVYKHLLFPDVRLRDIGLDSGDLDEVSREGIDAGNGSEIEL
ncbi:hypothetical protein V7S43_006282 [Phytophthora oleae]|uniref:Crinkler effector protein N-terminal domain-containing protein n=1 Tax=Phytophthora oleae TaxID=2107226 RepID=A0ABD3FTP5_9STRA